MAFNAYYNQGRYAQVNDNEDDQVTLSEISRAQYAPNAPSNYAPSNYDQSTAYTGAGMVQNPYDPTSDQRGRPASIYSNYSSYSGFDGDQKAFDNMPSDVQGISTKPSFIIPPKNAEDNGNPYVRKFNRTRQLWYLIAWTMLRWLGTAGLIGGLLFTFITYEKKKVMTSSEKRIFNTLVTGLALFLGLNLAFQITNGVGQMEDLGTTAAYSGRCVDLILDFSSMSKNVALIFKRSTYLSLRLGLSIWLALNLGAQLATALIGLTYELNSYTSNTEYRIGEVSVPIISEFLPGWNRTALIRGNDQFLSHLYGDTATSFESSLIDPIANGQDDSIYNYDATRQTFTYTFRDRHPTDKTRYTITNRTVSTNSKCSSVPIVSGSDGYNASVRVNFPDIGVADVPLAAGGGTNAIHYILPGQYGFGYCGTRCSTIYVFQPTFKDGVTSKAQAANFFSCNISTSTVSNIYYPIHNLTDYIAIIAGAAISLSGFADIKQSLQDQFESTRYLQGSYYGTPRTYDAEGIQSLTSEFAIGVIAGLGELNVRTNVTGQLPLQGVQLQVRWDRLGITLALIGIGQLVLLLSANIWANTVIVRDGSYLAMARILRPLVEPFGRHGCLVDGKTIADSFRQPLLYGVRTLHFPQSRSAKDDLHHLEIGPVDRKLKAQFWFPEGTYD